MFLTLFSQNILDGSCVPGVRMLVTVTRSWYSLSFFFVSLSYEAGHGYIFVKCEILRGRSEEEREQERNYLYRGKYIKGGDERILEYLANKKKCKYYF